MKSEGVAQSCPTLWDPMNYTVHGILQARILEWVAFPFSRGSSQPRDQTQDSNIAGGFFTSWATREALMSVKGKILRMKEFWAHLRPKEDRGEEIDVESQNKQNPEG